LEPKVLIACPTWSGCEYALKAWADAYHAQTYANKGALQVDNSDGPQTGGNLHYLHTIRGHGIPAIWQTVRFPALWDTLELSWREMVTYAHERGYHYIFSVEADVIIPPEATQKMVDCSMAQGTDKPAVVTQRYHPRGQEGPNFYWDTLGCSLFPVEPLWQDLDLVKAIYEIEVFTTLQRHGYPRYRPGHDGPDLFEVEHLKNPDDGYVNAYGATPAPSAYMKRVMEANGMKLNGEPAVLSKDAMIPMGQVKEPEPPPDGADLSKVYRGQREIADRAIPLAHVKTDAEAMRIVNTEDRIRLNIGCDRTQIGGFLGVDFNPDVNPDVLAPADKLPYEDNTVDEIYASHVLEHLPYENKALEEWLRVLKPGGLLTVAVPDIYQTYVLWKHGGTWGEYHMPITEVYMNAVAFGANLLADAIPEMKDMYGGPGHAHKQIFINDMLLNRVISAGFVHAHETQQCFLRHAAIGEVMVEAQKPVEGE
jgi:predicted SAM-dependent methyltransferase